MATRRARTGERVTDLAAAVKTARDVMRKDAGLSGELDRIPQFAWLLFLKAFDDLERKREVTERSYRSVIGRPYRWRDWASDPTGATGQELLTFVNAKLLPHLRQLRGSAPHDSRDVLAAVFKETHNRMLSGYLLRDILNVVSRVDFASSDDVHTMARLYESMLREMRDAAGDSGEFYTPRPLIRFIVQQVDPRLGDVILDPAAGTGGFLVETLEHLRPKADTTQRWRALQRDLRGIEKKPLPYLLGMMNLLLHGVEQPNLRRDNALATPVAQISAAAKVDVVLTNPPFGGEEEQGIQANFPAVTRTSRTELLFVQVIQRSLRPGGRCGMVVPNGLLFGSDVAAKVKERLLAECELHTIVRLPPGVFAPYTAIPTNLLFFDRTGPTKEIWFYELPPPAGRKNYSKTNPLQFEEFNECQRWWGGPKRAKRVEHERAWRVPIADIVVSDYNLDRSNPNRIGDLADLPPEKLVADLFDRERQISELLRDIQAQLTRGT